MIKQFVVYNAAGDVLRYGTCPAAALKDQAQEGEFVIEAVCTNDEREMVVDGQVVEKPYVPPEPQPQDARKALTVAVQTKLDTEARAKGYDNIISACSYAGAPNPFQQEGIDFLNWRASVWGYCYQALEDVEAGLRPTPTEEELLAELPVLVFTTN